MKMKIKIILAVILAMFAALVESENILLFTTLPSYSHFVIVDPILQELANRGHNVTAVTYFPQKKPNKNIHEIDISHTEPLLTGAVPVPFILSNWRQTHSMIKFIMLISQNNCEAVLKDKSIEDLIKNKNVKYDLVITELFGSDCFAAFAHKFKCPLATISTTVGFPWLVSRFGNPDNPSYIPAYFATKPDEMNLFDRIVNTATIALSNIAYHYLSEIPAQKLMEDLFKEKLPPIGDIVRNSSVVLTNTHYSFRKVQPNLPNYVEIGGIHLKDPKPLPKEIQDLMDNSPEGVVIVSLGSVLRCSTLPKETLTAFINAFNKLPFRILWKVEDEIAGLGKNVVLRKWFPIKDLLDHPNTKLLFMHGGMATTIETVNAGIPIVGLPMFADQFSNVYSLEHRGAGIVVDYYDITEESLYNAIYEVATDDSYRKNMKKLSTLFKDRPHTPLETSMFWLEYVMRHKGATHLRSPAASLPWYQLMLLDVISVILLGVSTVIFILYFLLKTIKNLVFTSKDKKKKQS